MDESNAARWYRYVRTLGRQSELSRRSRRARHYASFHCCQSHNHHRHSYSHSRGSNPCKGTQAEMRSYIKFSFGVGNYFKFSFSLGHPRDSSSKDRDDTKKDLADFDKAMAKKNGIQLDDPDKPVSPKPQDACPLFRSIPAEIRHMIYKCLLTTPEPIQKVHTHLGSKETAMLDSYSALPDIDSAILRTCRLIYSEALPILYGQNVFQFDCAHNIRSFQSKNLTNFPIGMQFSYPFNLKLAPMGRLTMLRQVTLNLDSEYPMNRRSNGQRFPPDRDRIWREWTMHVFSQDKDAYFRYSGRDDVEFPALEKLKLDFTEWQLADTEGLLVKPFVSKLAEHGRLQEVVLKGVKHQGTIDGFRTGLLKEGGVLRLED